jgi:hypothetical protein
MGMVANSLGGGPNPREFKNAYTEVFENGTRKRKSWYQSDFFRKAPIAIIPSFHSIAPRNMRGAHRLMSHLMHGPVHRRTDVHELCVVNCLDAMLDSSAYGFRRITAGGHEHPTYHLLPLILFHPRHCSHKLADFVGANRIIGAVALALDHPDFQEPARLLAGENVYATVSALGGSGQDCEA